MIANFFRSLNQHRVEYLLISGQATVLYGAATFSEDIDLWLHPTEDNCSRFLAALRDCGVRYYTLTARVNVGMQQRIAGLQQADRRYWRDIIDELRHLRAAGKLMAEGSAV